MESGGRLRGYEKAQVPFTHPPVSPCKVQQNNQLDFGWINRCVKRCPCYREPHTIEHCGHWAHLGPTISCGVDYTGFTGLPQAVSGPHGQRLSFSPSPSRATSLLLCDSGKTWPLNGELISDRDLRELKFPFLLSHQLCRVLNNQRSTELGESAGQEIWSY